MARYHTPSKGTTDWHEPLNENFENLDRDIEIRDTESNLDEYEPWDGAKFLSIDTGDVYVGNGADWEHLGTIGLGTEDSGSAVGRAATLNFGENLTVTDDENGTHTVDAAGGAGGDVAAVDGIATTRANVGAMVGGTYHSSTFGSGGYGVVFEAEDLHIDSVVVDSDLSDVSDPDLTIQLRQFDSGAAEPLIIDETTVTLSGGPERIPLGFDVPASDADNADPNDQYMLHRGAPNGDDIPLRRRFADDGDWSAADFADETYTDPPIDFLQGHNNDSGFSYDPPDENWYYFFDWLVGPAQDRVTSPWSTDVTEIYMRDRDPTEEFDDVHPRALWIDTSGA